MKKIALIEFNPYHDECLYSQIKFLAKSGYSITLVINNEIYKRSSELSNLVEDVTVIRPSSQKNLFKRIGLIFNLKKLLKKEGIKTVVFNTASSRLEVILLSYLLRKNTRLFGILHNLKKLHHSFSQKLINKSVKNYFVLNDFLKDSIELKDTSIQLSSFYPIFLPSYNATSIKKPKGEIWISIPGKLDFGRRDYYLVAKALQQIQTKSDLKILILGNRTSKDPKNQDFMEFIKANGLHDNFITFDSFLDNNSFHGYLKKSDYILIPLDSVGENYSTYKIMGCYNQAFSYKINLISPTGLNHIPDIKNHSIFYDGVKELAKILGKINQGEINKKEYEENKWSFDKQKNNYVCFIEHEQIETK